jgi:hypothetical protein
MSGELCGFIAQRPATEGCEFERSVGSRLRATYPYSLALGFTVVVVKVSKTDRGYKYGKYPAHCHCEKLGGKHENCIYEKNVLTHDKADDALIDEAGIRIKKSADDSENHHADRH